MHVPHAASPRYAATPRRAIPDTDGMTVAYVLDTGVSYLLAQVEGPGDPLTLLLPTQSEAVSGLAVYSRLSSLHSRHWALVWGAGDPPPSGVDFSSGDLRFRRQVHSPGAAVGAAWVALAAGVFREATVDPDGPTPRWLSLVTSW